MSSFPPRCFTCGKVIGNLWEKYEKLTKEHSVDNALDKMKIRRFCCRRMFITHVPSIDKDMSYYF